MTIDKNGVPVACDTVGAVPTLREQAVDWNDLHLAFQEAALNAWHDFSRDAARVFCQGA